MKLLLSALALGLITLHASAQVVRSPAKMIDLGKGQVTCW